MIFFTPRIHSSILDRYSRYPYFQLGWKSMNFIGHLTYPGIPYIGIHYYLNQRMDILKIEEEILCE